MSDPEIPSDRVFGTSTSPPGALAKGVNRSFGAVQAVRNVDLVAERGQVTALVGPNGAGKTTLLLMLATLLAPDGGMIRVAGHDPVTETDAVRAHMGWSPDVFGLYDNLTIREYITYSALSYRIGRDRVSRRVDEMLEMAGLADRAHRPVHELSRGQKQRLGLVRALVHDPDVLLLDEPASGLDPGSRIQLRQLLRKLAANGLAIVISSHLLDDLEEMADSVVFMKAGVTISQQRSDELRRSLSGRTWRVVTRTSDRVKEVLDSYRLIYERNGEQSFSLELTDEEAAADLLTELVTAGARISVFAPWRGDMEAAYLRMTEEDNS